MAAQAIQKALDAAQEEFKGFERRDAKSQIELKNLRAKVKKLATKIETDGAEAAVGVDLVLASELLWKSSTLLLFAAWSVSASHGCCRILVHVSTARWKRLRACQLRSGRCILQRITR